MAPITFVLLVALIIYRFGDVTWWGSVALFGPRWIWAVPWPVIFAASAAAAFLAGDRGWRPAAELTLSTAVRDGRQGYRPL